MTYTTAFNIQAEAQRRLRTNLFKLVLATLQIQMLPDRRVLASESDNLLPIEVVEQPRVDFPRELNG